MAVSTVSVSESAMRALRGPGPVPSCEMCLPLECLSLGIEGVEPSQFEQLTDFRLTATLVTVLVKDL